MLQARPSQTPQKTYDCGSFDASELLFSWGLMVERITIIWLSRSNQNGAPRVIAIAVRNHPVNTTSRRDFESC